MHAATDVGVLEYSAKHGLPDWWIEGRDLIMVRPAPADDVPIPPEQLVEAIASLLPLARLFATTPLDRYGTQPTIDLPLRPEIRRE